jgi:hypothetical protein
LRSSPELLGLADVVCLNNSAWLLDHCEAVETITIQDILNFHDVISVVRSEGYEMVYSYCVEHSKDVSCMLLKLETLQYLIKDKVWLSDFNNAFSMLLKSARDPAEYISIGVDAWDFFTTPIKGKVRCECACNFPIFGTVSFEKLKPICEEYGGLSSSQQRHIHSWKSCHETFRAVHELYPNVSDIAIHFDTLLSLQILFESLANTWENFSNFIRIVWKLKYFEVDWILDQNCQFFFHKMYDKYGDEIFQDFIRSESNMQAAVSEVAMDTLAWLLLDKVMPETATPDSKRAACVYFSHSVKSGKRRIAYTALLSYGVVNTSWDELMCLVEAMVRIINHSIDGHATVNSAMNQLGPNPTAEIKALFILYLGEASDQGEFRRQLWVGNSAVTKATSAWNIRVLIDGLWQVGEFDISQRSLFSCILDASPNSEFRLYDVVICKALLNQLVDSPSHVEILYELGDVVCWLTTKHCTMDDIFEMYHLWESIRQSPCKGHVKRLAMNNRRECLRLLPVFRYFGDSNMGGQRLLLLPGSSTFEFHNLVQYNVLNTDRLWSGSEVTFNWLHYHLSFLSKGFTEVSSGMYSGLGQYYSSWRIPSTGLF